MADQELYERLLDEGDQFDFFQAVWLLEQFYAQKPELGESSSDQPEHVRFRPHTSMAFPARDIESIEQVQADDIEPDDHVRMTVTFMGLYGVAAAMPPYFFKKLIGRGRKPEDPPQKEHPLRDFLDIFNHRIYTFFYRAWKKYRSLLGYRKREQDDHARRFLSLAGYYALYGQQAARGPVAPLRLAALAGRLMGPVRNAEGLQALLAAMLSGIPVEVIENMPRWVPLPQKDQTQLGSPRFELGKSFLVGKSIYDRSSKFRIRIGPMDEQSYLDLLPGGAKAKAVLWLIRRYVSDYLVFDVELGLQTDDIAPIRLGRQDGKGVRMGYATFVGQPQVSVYRRVVTYE